MVVLEPIVSSCTPCLRTSICSLLLASCSPSSLQQISDLAFPCQHILTFIVFTHGKVDPHAAGHDGGVAAHEHDLEKKAEQLDIVDAGNLCPFEKMAEQAKTVDAGATCPNGKKAEEVCPFEKAKQAKDVDTDVTCPFEKAKQAKAMDADSTCPNAKKAEQDNTIDAGSTCPFEKAKKVKCVDAGTQVDILDAGIICPFEKAKQQAQAIADDATCPFEKAKQDKTVATDATCPNAKKVEQVCPFEKAKQDKLAEAGAACPLATTTGMYQSLVFNPSQHSYPLYKTRKTSKTVATFTLCTFTFPIPFHVPNFEKPLLTLHPLLHWDTKPPWHIELSILQDGSHHARLPDADSPELMRFWQMLETQVRLLLRLLKA